MSVRTEARDAVAQAVIGGVGRAGSSTRLAYDLLAAGASEYDCVERLITVNAARAAGKDRSAA